MKELTPELQASIPEHGARQQPRLEEHLEAVADPEDRTTSRRKLRDLLHDGREPRNRPCPQVVAMCEPTGQDHHVCATEAPVLVPNEFSVLAENVPGHVIGVVVAIRPGENDNGEFHDVTSMR
jgi:hypothetical protein